MEVLCVMNGRFYMLAGEDGSVKRVYDLPDPEAHDCIVIANLSGGERAADILLKDRYRRIWALNHDFELLWTHEGNTGHYPWACDLNGDGYDEVMAGYDLLDHQGHVLWSCRDLEDHADCIWVGDVNGDGAPELVIGGSVTVMYSRDGKELWRYDGSIESQHIALGKFRSDLPGLQVAGLDRMVREDDGKGLKGKDALFMLDGEGRELWKEERQTSGWLTIAETLSGWYPGAPDYILAYRRGGGVFPALYDGELRIVAQFGHEGYAVHGDLLGRGTEQVIIYDDELAVLFASEPLKLSGAFAAGSESFDSPSGKALFKAHGRLARCRNRNGFTIPPCTREEKSIGERGEALVPPYFHEYDAIARVAAGRVEPVLSAVAGRFVGANPPRPPVYRVHSRRGFKRLADCRYDMDLVRRWPDLTPGQFVYVWGMLWCEQKGETPFSVSCYSPVKVYVNGALAFQSNLNDDVFPDRKAFFRAKTGKGRNDIVLEFTAAGTGCGGVFGTGSVKGAPLHFLNPTPEGRGCEGWVYSGPQAKRWDRLPGAVEGERWGGSRSSGKREDAENAENAGNTGNTGNTENTENAKNHENCQNLVGMNQGCIYGAWHPQDRWSPQELEAGCFARLFGSEAKSGDKVFAWCKLETRKFPAANVRIAGHYEGAATVYIDGRPVSAARRNGAASGSFCAASITVRMIWWWSRFGAVAAGDLGIDKVRELEEGETGNVFGEGAIATAQATEHRRASEETPAFSGRNRVRLMRPYPVDGMTETWLYAGPFSGETPRRRPR
ncbi:hypothetical protein HMSSN036_38760 [Paenibacillus macerans]|nr:hypothetical protein HMSSN036_38760 [Paenibacillus macerans]